jgi:hypothetical protein
MYLVPFSLKYKYTQLLGVFEKKMLSDYPLILSCVLNHLIKVHLMLLTLYCVLLSIIALTYYGEFWAYIHL